MAEDAEEEPEGGETERLEEFGWTSLLMVVVMGIIIAFIAAVGVAMILGIPILKGLFGQHVVQVAGLSVVGPGTTALATDPVTQILQAFIDGLVSILKSIFSGIVLVVGTIASVVAAVFTAIFMAPIQFFTAAWQTASASLAGFGIGAPVAMVLVVISVFAILAVSGYLLVRGSKSTEEVITEG